jgi:hypothetical protein
MDAEQDAFAELCCYTLAHGDRSFIHQHVVDAFAVQLADAQTKPIAITFGLIGLYLHIEKQFSGRQVQRVHMLLAQRKRPWPVFHLPRDRGAITVAEVLAAPAGPERDKAIDAWCSSVWQAFRGSRQAVVDLLLEYGIFNPVSPELWAKRRDSLPGSQPIRLDRGS